MDAESVRRYLLALPHVEETVQWGGRLVYWVAEKSVGGRIFAVMNLEADEGRVLSFVAGPELFAELVEMDGIQPAPYFARAHWIALEHWSVLRPADLHALLAAAREIAYQKLPAHTRAFLALPPTQRKKLQAMCKPAKKIAGKKSATVKKKSAITTTKPKKKRK